MHAPEPDHERLRRYLQALPEPLPPASLEHRLRASQTRRSRVLRTGASALALGLVVVLALPGHRGPQVESPPGAGGAAIVAVAPGAFPDSGDAAHMKLRAIDRALQTAYGRGASDAELAPLWEARLQLVRDLVPSNTVDSGTSS
ncbi:hypothetical protein [Marilutibacter aestuarii]|uniref:Uncharacterized protein n=1 Tax=Marilutibacter aestuarii TaxID=1706195 RepID=A0A508AMG6_9GAMM|nr:hypothetical protein [Lysobacter aestuarii]TQD48295.1 hypothetical protein FKV25_04965 [Lysobacter aestuarii]